MPVGSPDWLHGRSRAWLAFAERSGWETLFMLLAFLEPDTYHIVAFQLGNGHHRSTGFKLDGVANIERCHKENVIWG